jgi:hypothetical protein
MKALKIFGRIFFTVFFIFLIFCIVIVLSYTLVEPSRTGEARTIITGPWADITDEKTVFTFKQDGKFTIEIDGTQVADGYFKVDEDSSKIKMLMWPNHYTSAFSKYVKFKVLAEISYDKLEYPKTDDMETDEINEDDPPTVTYLLREVDGTDSVIYECKMTESTIDLYASENDLTKDA